MFARIFVLLPVFLGLVPHSDLAATHRATITITPLNPEANGVINEVFVAAASVSSTMQLQEVRVDIAGRSATLTYDFDEDAFFGTVDVADLPSGNYTCTFTAADVLGLSTSVDVPVVLDRRPEVHVTLPVDWSVTTGAIHVAASCTDSEGPCTLRAQGSGGDMIEGSTSIEGTLFLVQPSWGALGHVSFTAFDNRGQEGGTVYRVYIVEDPAWTSAPTFSADGYIFDVEADRVLFGLDFYQDYHLGRTWHRAGLLDRSTGTVSYIPLPERRVLIPPTNVGQQAYATGTGALLVSPLQGGSHSDQRILDWNQGVLFDLGPIQSAHALFAAGTYATWQNGSALFWRDLVHQATSLVGTAFSNNGYPVGPDGRLVYTRSDMSSWLFTSPDAVPFSTHVGAAQYEPDAIYYVRQEGSAMGEILRYDGATHQPLVTNMSGSYLEREDWGVNAGWLAFERLSITSVPQVWIRSPDGEERQVSVFPYESEFEAIGPTGEVFFFNNNRRYWANALGDYVEVGPKDGSVEWLDGGWHLILGRSAIPFNQTVTATEPQPLPHSEALALHSASPNPFRRTTRLTFTLPEARIASLSIYDVLGRRIATLTNEALTAGAHTITWDASAVPSGVYRAVLHTGTERASLPLTVLH